MQPLSISDIKALRLRFAGARRVGILSHTHPDGDAVGSSSALAAFLEESMGKTETRVILPDAPSRTLNFLLRKGRTIIASDTPEAARAWIESCDLLILIDANEVKRTELLEPLFLASPAEKVLIDHHVGPERELFGCVFSETEVSSACELLFWILMSMEETEGNAARLPAVSARALLAGMTTDTNNFANSVFPTTLQMASMLLEAGVDRDAILEKIYNCYRENRVRAMGYLQSECLHITPSGASYMVATKEIVKRFDIQEGETEGLVNVPLAIDKVKVSVFLKEDDGFFRVSIRSKEGWSARNLAKLHFHGGGHEKASGGKLFFPEDIARAQDVEAFLEKVCEEYMK